jgi:CHAD domain-containing protein
MNSRSEVLALLCDDEVRAERLHGSHRVHSWREWEVELVDGHRDVLDAVEQRLVAAGAAPASAGSKLARALGDALPQPAPRRSPPKPSRATAAEVVLAHLARHTGELHGHDAGVRAGHAESVHRLRIAARRLRSALTTYRPLFSPGSTDPLRDELRWLGQTMAEARDGQVLRERLTQLVASEPAELVMGPVMARLDQELGAATARGRAKAVEALASGRYYRLLDALDQLLESPPFLPDADARAAKVLPRLLERDARRLRRAALAVDEDGSPEERDRSLHEVRKKAKRLRYAAESAVGTYPKRAPALTAAAKRVQEILGVHQDTVVARQRLREYAVSAHLSGENAFTFGRLHALEQCQAERSVREFADAWQALPRRDLRRWLRT